jgi:hypothetical protein
MVQDDRKRHSDVEKIQRFKLTRRMVDMTGIAPHIRPIPEFPTNRFEGVIAG